MSRMHRPTGHLTRQITGQATTVLAVVLALALAVLTGCSDEQELSDSDHNSADVAFTRHMIPHHAQALALVDLIRGRDLDPDFVALAEGMRDTQTEEIEQFADWLDEWDQDMPATMRDHVHAGHGRWRPSDALEEMERGNRGGPGGPGMPGMSGMLSAADFREIEDAPDDESFTRRWLEAMIFHHEGAVEMADAEVDEGQYRPTVELAETIARTQRAEIATMKQMLQE